MPMDASVLEDQASEKNALNTRKAKVRKSSISYDTETITPEIAREMLATVQRPPAIDKKVVSHYAAAMKAGGWLSNGQAIKIDRNGQLIDGYHRLQACIEAGVPFRTLVARNIKADILHTIDQHRRRNFTTVLKARNIQHATDIHRTLGKLIRIENGVFKMLNLPVTWERLDIVLESNPEIIEAAKIAHDTPVRLLPSKAQTTFIFMALKSGHEELLREFIQKMDTDGRNISFSDPVGVLMSTLTSLIENSTSGSIDPDVALGIAIQAFNDCVTGEAPPRAYSWRPDYGDLKIYKDAKPSLKAIRESAPPNCGLPSMVSYPGLTDGLIDNSDSYKNEMQIFRGTTADMLIAAAKIEGDVSVYHVEITPAVAQNWLDNFNKVNRVIQKAHIQRISRDIASGNWMLNAEPISFHGNPLNPEDGPVRLINGQHRLLACVMADTPIELAISVNVPEAAFATYDNHTKRHKKAHEGDGRVVRSAAILQWRIDQGLSPRSPQRPTATEHEKTMEMHPGLTRWAAEIRRGDGGDRADQIALAAPMTFFLYRIHEENPQLARELYAGMRTGANLSADNPIIKLRDMKRFRTGPNKLNRYDAVDMLFEHWEKFKKWKADKSKSEAQPRLID
jgi:hypothetical protein